MSDGSPQRPILLSAVRDLIAGARSRRATISAAAPERQFFLGVEAAAEEIVHPELTVGRDEGWLDRHHREFRDGYLRTATMLTHARTATEPPLHLPLPEPRAT